MSIARPTQPPCPRPLYLFPNGLQVSVSHQVLSQLHSGQPGAARIGEELEKAVLRLKIAVCVDELYITTSEEKKKHKVLSQSNHAIKYE